MKRVLTTAIALLSLTALQAQTSPLESHDDFTTVYGDSWLDGGITLGTTGIGVEVTGHVYKDLDVRGGFDFYPHFNYDMHFNVTVGDDQTDPEAAASRFQRMASTLQSLTGYKVDDRVTMEGTPKMYNFKLLVDYKPLRNKNWHVTAGFYWGNSKIATAENAKEDMTSLFAVGLYNHIYECAYYDQPYITINGQDLYLDVDVENKIVEYGRMGVHVGTYKHDITDAEGNVVHKAGDTYNMEPDENSMVKASVKVNSFKPYLGIGYMGTLTRKDPRWKVGFDAGVLFWGGTPEMKTHDGTDLIDDVTDLRHGVKKYVNLCKAMKVMPVLNFRITRTIF